MILLKKIDKIAGWKSSGLSLESTATPNAPKFISKPNN